MKTLQSFSITPVAAALCLGGALLAAGCKGHDADDNKTAAPAATSTAMPPANATAGMASDTSAMNAPPAASTTSAAMPPAEAMASGPISDTDFYRDAMTGDQKEISSAQLVQKQGSNADVKALAKKIESDHAALDKKLKAAAGSKATTPSTADTTDNTLTGKTGADLDKAYVDAMVSDHQADIPKFENAAQNASTAEAKKLASDALPTLRDHLKMAQDLQQKLASGK